ncbi:Glutathione S-transferase-like protein [Legionella fallonii LLAP-10]|uniref:Glutathione S-transferase-like protein n=2 Tax=Legionella fallonii TaxID=96230 RepID=A0A098G924_9GAMM|nr:Glutathione S-transferase-like protein [Legionella fallonii LLAP-10]
MALAYAHIQVEQREVDLKNKPLDMLKASAKGTVPVLILESGQVIDQSIDIMLWALTQSDCDGWLNLELKDKSDELIYNNDVLFKPLLDRYKYSQLPEESQLYKEQSHRYLHQLNRLLMKHHYLLTDKINLADVALFPFIRQFSMVDSQWFEQTEYKHLHAWLQSFLSSELFLSVMKKHP